MRALAAFCFAFAAGVFAAQYLIQPWLLLYAAPGCLAVGALWAICLHGDRRRRALLIASGLALALCWDRAYVRLVYEPFERLAGTQQTFVMEVADDPSATEYGSRVEVFLPGRGLYGRAVYYGDASLLGAEPGTRITGGAFVKSAAAPNGEPVSTHTARGVFALLYARGEAAVEDGNAGALRYLPRRLARRMQETVTACFSERTAPFLNAILLGDRYELSAEDTALLREAGLTHVTAVSGLHCAFLLSLLTLLIGRHRRRLLSAVTLPVLALYAVMAGLTPSVLRACVMLALWLLAPLFRRDGDAPTSLGFALFLILLANPFAAKSVSLQLSFAAVAGLLWLAPRLFERIAARPRSKAAAFVLGSLTATAGALVFTVPLSAVYFGSVALVAPLSNLLCLGAASLTFATGLLATLAGMISLPLGHALAQLPQLGARYLLTAARLLGRLPLHALHLTGEGARLWLVYVYAMLCVCCFSRRGRLRWATAGVLAALTLALTLWLDAQPLRSGTLHLVALDVGQGQSVVLYSEGAAALIDCGSSSYLDAGDVTADYLQSVGIDRLDYIALSHYHADHCDGLPTLLARLKAERLILPDIEPQDEQRAEVLALAERCGVPVTFVRERERFPLGGAALTVYPPLTEGEMNEECLSVLCTAGEFDALFTGDMDADTEYRLIATYPLPDIEVLMVGHHGSRCSTGGDLLAEVKPELAVVSCGADNGYGHPHSEALRRLTDAGASVCRTDLQGNIHITVN